MTRRPCRACNHRDQGGRGWRWVWDDGSYVALCSERCERRWVRAL